MEGLFGLIKALPSRQNTPEEAAAEEAAKAAEEAAKAAKAAAKAARETVIEAKITELKGKNARKADETQEVYDARKRRNAEGLVDANASASNISAGIHKEGPTPKLITHTTNVLLKRKLYRSDNKILEELLAKAATVHLNPAEVDQVNTIKRIYTMLQIRAKDSKEYEAKLKDYSKLLQGYFKETADKKGWFGTTKGRNTFKYLRNAQANTTRTKNVHQSIEIQQMHAYNEILGLILSLTAKAHNKFQSKTAFEWLRQRSKERLTARAVSSKDLIKDEKAWYDLLNSYVTKYDSDAGIYSLSTISAEYVYDIVARGKVRKLLNLREELSASLKTATNRVDWLFMLLWRGVLPVSLAASLYRGLTMDIPTITTSKFTVYGTPAVISSGKLSAVYHQLHEIGLAIQTHFLDIIPGLVPAVSEALMIVNTFAIPAAAMLTYRTVRGAQKTGTFKSEFIELHKILFNIENKITFDAATHKESFFVFNQLSPVEKSAIREFKKAFATGTPSDESIKTYLAKMLQGGQERQVQELLNDISPEQATIFDKKARKLYPSYVGWDLSYNPITSSFTYDCASDPSITAWPDASKYGILNKEYCKTCSSAHCTSPPRPVKVGGSRRNRWRKLRKTRRNQTYY